MERVYHPAAAVKTGARLSVSKVKPQGIALNLLRTPIFVVRRYSKL